MLAGTSVGDGPKSSPIDVKTDEDGRYPVLTEIDNDLTGQLFVANTTVILNILSLSFLYKINIPAENYFMRSLISVITLRLDN